MPEIQEEAESAGKASPLKSLPTQGRLEADYMSASAPSFQLSNFTIPLQFFE